MEKRNEPRRLWTREELILALNLYLTLPFGKLHSGTLEIISLANLLNRTPGSIAMRLNNFATVDPFHQQRGIGGLPGGQKQVQPIWDEFIHNRETLLFESEKLLAKYQGTSLEKKYDAILNEAKELKGEDKLRLVKTRVNQHAFRKIVLANYNFKCAITGINIPDLLLASHIVPWSANEAERLNPENGICLSPLYDRAYDKGLISITIDYKIVLSKKLSSYEKQSFHLLHFGKLHGQKINLPSKYMPSKVFLEYHMKEVFI